MIELLTAFILYTYGAHWIWWFMFIIAIISEGVYYYISRKNINDA